MVIPILPVRDLAEAREFWSRSGLHTRLEAAGLPVTPVRQEPWGMTEFSVRDPDGNLVRVGRAVRGISPCAPRGGR